MYQTSGFLQQQADPVLEQRGRSSSGFLLF